MNELANHIYKLLPAVDASLKQRALAIARELETDEERVRDMQCNR